MKVWTIMRKPLLFGAFTLTGLAMLVASADATHWSQSGADGGRSGFQPADQTFLPAPFRWRNTLDGYSAVTSPIITGGASPTEQRVVVGNYTDLFMTPECGQDLLDTTIYVLNFATGEKIVCHDLDSENPTNPDSPDAGTGSDSDGWGPEGNLTPVEASTHNAPGQVYAIYNDDNPGSPYSPTHSDISLAQIDAATGDLIADRVLQNTLGGSDFDSMTVSSAPALSGDLGDGSRQMFFIITGGDAKHIVKLTIPNATANTSNAPSVSIGPNIADLNPTAAPTIVRMQDPDTGVLVTMVAVGTTDGIKTFRASNLADPGPSVSGLGLTWTPAAPVRADGAAPSPTQVLYAASVSGEAGTVVRRFMQDVSARVNPDVERLKNLIPYQTDGYPAATSTSPTLSGTPSKQLALDVKVPSTGPDLRPQPGHVVVSTSTNIFVLDTDDLSLSNPPSVFSADREVGFKKTFPATSGGLGFIADDKGTQFVFLLELNEDGNLRVPSDEEGFLPHEESLNSTSASGQVAISRGRFIFTANNGLFTYGPNTTITLPAANGSVRGNAVQLQAHVANSAMNSVDFFVDDQYVGTDAVDDNDTFTVTWDSLSKLDGPHTVYAVATDGVDTDRSATRTFVVVNFANPTADLTVGPNPANPGDIVTLDARNSKPTPTEVDETITEWAFELDGDADFNDVIETAANGGDGLILHAFEAGTRNVGVRVTDSHGDQHQKVLKLRINTPPAANLVIGPNPAAEGQEVAVDASTSTDVDGAIARYEFDLDGNGTFEHDNGANPKVQRVFGPGTTKVGARVTDNEGASSVVTADLVVNAKPANQIPVATFRVTPNPVNTDTRVLFDATGARDPDGTVAKYEWDLDGNGTFETNSQNNPRVQRSYATPKVYNVKLRVTDNLGAVSIDFTGTLTVRQAGRKLPRRLSAKVTPMRDAAQPFNFRTTGRLTLPRGLTKKAGCNGRITVVVKAGKKTISRRTTRLRSNCTYRTSVRFRDSNRFGSASRLRFTARFQGNKVLRARQATSVRVRVG